MDELTAGSPSWWLHRLAGQLLMDQPRMILMDRYYRGDHPIPFVPRVLKREFRRMLARSRSNFMEVVIDARVERLKLQGFRAPGAEEADAAQWERWMASEMHTDINLAITNALVMGRGPMSVWRFNGDTEATIQVEDPRTTLIAYDQRNRHRPVAALRLWIDEWTARTRADVHLPDGCYQFSAGRPQVLRSRSWPAMWSPGYEIDQPDVAFTEMVMREDPIAFDQWHRQWTPLDFIPNPHGVIPFVEITNKPTGLKVADGTSDLANVYLSQDRINEGLFNRSLAAWTTAYRQKWATGIEIPVDETTGEEIEPFQAAIDRLWVAEGENAKFGDFAETRLDGFISSIEQDVQHVIVQTRTPRHYLETSGQEPSGDSIKSAETGLVAVVYGKQPGIARSAVRAKQLQDQFSDRPIEPLGVVWGDAETRTLAEQTDAIIKQFGAKLIPRRVAQERLGYSPDEIQRMEADFAQEELVDAARQLLQPTEVVDTTAVEIPA